MLDIALDQRGDLVVSESGDIALSDDLLQNARVRLRWFLNEWKFNPAIGMPYYESVFVKNPSPAEIERAVTGELLKINGVTDVSKVRVIFDLARRVASVEFTFHAGDSTYTGEVGMP